MLVHGARKLDAEGVVGDFWFAAEGEVITATGTGDAWKRLPDDTTVTDAAGSWLTPGFIDLHAHGGGGAGFDSDAAGIRSALALHRSHGTTRSVLSLVTAPLDALCSSLGIIAGIVREDPLVLGSHLEGPFLAESRRGAHDPALLLMPMAEYVEALRAAADRTLRQVTLAPELPGALDAVEALVAADVVVAVGHTAADYELTRSAFDRGARLLTHAFNAMAGIHHRAPGPVAAALQDQRVTLELVLDGVHVHPSVAHLAFAAAPGRIALITDAMAAAGAVDGEYSLGSLAVSVIEGVARLAGTDTIAGSTLTMDAALGVAIDRALVDPVAAVEALTLTPARVLGRADLGLLRPGFAADAVLLDDRFRALGVWADGRPIA